MKENVDKNDEKCRQKEEKGKVRENPWILKDLNDDDGKLKYKSLIGSRIVTDYSYRAFKLQSQSFYYFEAFLINALKR